MSSLSVAQPIRFISRRKVHARKEAANSIIAADYNKLEEDYRNEISLSKRFSWDCAKVSSSSSNLSLSSFLVFKSKIIYEKIIEITIRSFFGRRFTKNVFISSREGNFAKQTLPLSSARFAYRNGHLGSVLESKLPASLAYEWRNGARAAMTWSSASNQERRRMSQNRDEEERKQFLHKYLISLNNLAAMTVER